MAPRCGLVAPHGEWLLSDCQFSIKQGPASAMDVMFREAGLWRNGTYQPWAAKLQGADAELPKVCLQTFKDGDVVGRMGGNPLEWTELKRLAESTEWLSTHCLDAVLALLHRDIGGCLGVNELATQERTPGRICFLGCRFWAKVFQFCQPHGQASVAFDTVNATPVIQKWLLAVLGEGKGRVPAEMSADEIANGMLQIFEQFDQIVFPCNVADTHWVLAVIDLEYLCVRTYDSLPDGDYIDTVFGVVQHVLRIVHDSCRLLFEPYRWSRKREAVPLQKNGYDCGVFVLLFAAAVAEAKTHPGCRCWAFSQDDIPKARAWMLRRIYIAALGNGTCEVTGLCGLL